MSVGKDWGRGRPTVSPPTPWSCLQSQGKPGRGMGQGTERREFQRT